MSLSPNWGLRRHGLPPDMVVLHYTGMDSAEAAVDRLCDPAAEVSSHYVVTEDGSTLALVAEEHRAWHAGAGSWGNVTDVNSHSIGIEIVNPGPGGPTPAFPDSQMSAVETLLSAILGRWNIPAARVIGHSDMAPGRKQDPGPHFNWQRLAQRGLSVWPSQTVAVEGAETELWDRFVTAAPVFGYPAPHDQGTDCHDDPGWHATLSAFRLRFQPQQSGPITPRDVGIIENLAARYPCAKVDVGSANA
ncbi:MAG: N-acetylmuramoyl-L-alanine amidase [Pseudomonadota bacterium]